MSLPIVIVFERHWDIIPKFVIKHLLPALNKRGYETFCFEAPQDLSSAEIIDRHNAGLEADSAFQQKAEELLKQVGITTRLSEISFCSLTEQLRLYVSSKRYVEGAERIKQLPASHILKQIFVEASKLSMSLKGIDIGCKGFDKMTSVDLSKRMSSIRGREDSRITTIVQNLLKLRTQQKEGIIFSCGALHAKRLIDKLEDHGLQDEVLYYFPHSSSRYEESVDDIDALKTDTLEGHTYLLAQKDIKPFGERVIREITRKTKYTREILDYNSHSQFLSDRFKTNFRAFLRPGYHVDALVEVTEPSATAIKDIRRRVTAAGVQTHYISLNGRKYLAIPNVNSGDVAERIRKI